MKGQIQIWSSTSVSVMSGKEEMDKAVSRNGQTAGGQKSHRSPKSGAGPCVFLQSRRMRICFRLIPCALLVGLK